MDGFETHLTVDSEMVGSGVSENRLAIALAVTRMIASPCSFLTPIVFDHALVTIKNNQSRAKWLSLPSLLFGPSVRSHSFPHICLPFAMSLGSTHRLMSERRSIPVDGVADHSHVRKSSGTRPSDSYMKTTHKH
jgi:hypothetical protein